jgi:hypothetical protein
VGSRTNLEKKNCSICWDSNPNSSPVQPVIWQICRHNVYSPTALGSVGFVVNEVALRRFPPSISVFSVISDSTFINHLIILAIVMASLNKQLNEAKGSSNETADSCFVSSQGLAVFINILCMYVCMYVCMSIRWFPGQGVAGFVCVWSERNDECHNRVP